MVRHPNWKTILPAGAVAFTLCSQSAQAFFPPVPPTDTKVTVVSVPPSLPDPISIAPVQPVPPPPFVPAHQTVHKPCDDVDPPVTPQVVPEPMTLVSIATGLLAVAGWRVRRKAAE